MTKEYEAWSKEMSEIEYRKYRRTVKIMYGIYFIVILIIVGVGYEVD